MADLYTCVECGCHEFIVVHEYTLTEPYSEQVLCDCDGTDDGIAFVRQAHTATPYLASGELDDEHHWHEEWPEPMAEAEDQEDESEVFCGDCAENNEIQIAEDEGEYGDDEFYVRCNDCDREIEFGWSHPDRGGRIWPVEASDFNPWKSWPEPRYRDAWAAKNWLRPGVTATELAD